MYLEILIAMLCFIGTSISESFSIMNTIWRRSSIISTGVKKKNPPNKHTIIFYILQIWFLESKGKHWGKAEDKDENEWGEQNHLYLLLEEVRWRSQEGKRNCVLRRVLKAMQLKCWPWEGNGERSGMRIRNCWAPCLPIQRKEVWWKQTKVCRPPLTIQCWGASGPH